MLIILTIILILAVLSQIVGVSWKSKVLSEWCQPTEVNYDSFGPYCLRIIKQTKTLGSSLILAIVNQGNYQSGDYGYTLNYPSNKNPHLSDWDVDDFYVVWEEAGVKIVFQNPGGWELFIPKDSFIGGR